MQMMVGLTLYVNASIDFDRICTYSYRIGHVRSRQSHAMDL